MIPLLLLILTSHLAEATPGRDLCPSSLLGLLPPEALPLADAKAELRALRQQLVGEHPYQPLVSPEQFDFSTLDMGDEEKGKASLRFGEILPYAICQPEKFRLWRLSPSQSQSFFSRWQRQTDLWRRTVAQHHLALMSTDAPPSIQMSAFALPMPHGRVLVDFFTVKEKSVFRSLITLRLQNEYSWEGIRTQIFGGPPPLNASMIFRVMFHSLMFPKEDPTFFLSIGHLLNNFYIAQQLE